MLWVAAVYIGAILSMADMLDLYGMLEFKLCC